jgi:hypothetical protein
MEKRECVLLINIGSINNENSSSQANQSYWFIKAQSGVLLEYHKHETASGLLDVYFVGSQFYSGINLNAGYDLLSNKVKEETIQSLKIREIFGANLNEQQINNELDKMLNAVFGQPKLTYQTQGTFKDLSEKFNNLIKQTNSYLKNNKISPMTPNIEEGIRDQFEMELTKEILNFSKALNKDAANIAKALVALHLKIEKTQKKIELGQIGDFPYFKGNFGEVLGNSASAHVISGLISKGSRLTGTKKYKVLPASLPIDRTIPTFGGTPTSKADFEKTIEFINGTYTYTIELPVSVKFYEGDYFDILNSGDIYNLVNPGLVNTDTDLQKYITYLSTLPANSVERKERLGLLFADPGTGGSLKRALMLANVREKTNELSIEVQFLYSFFKNRFVNGQANFFTGPSGFTGINQIKLKAGGRRK